MKTYPEPQSVDGWLLAVLTIAAAIIFIILFGQGEMINIKEEAELFIEKLKGECYTLFLREAIDYLALGIISSGESKKSY